MMKHSTFTAAIERAKREFKSAPLIHTEKWQGVDIAKKPEMATYEILNHSFEVLCSQNKDPQNLTHWRADIKPNIPWADDHFAERVCGFPINPGIEWENWPYNKSASTFLENGKFNHNYMERYWPKFADSEHPPSRTPEEYVLKVNPARNVGIGGGYGDLEDIVQLLVREPATRQAYMPVFFPEDTGARHGSRIPCSIGYHFIMRDNQLNIVYQLRSCDFVRHFRDDIYLTLRLALWVLEKCAQESVMWKGVKLGWFTMHITSLHIFRNDYNVLFPEKAK